MAEWIGLAVTVLVVLCGTALNVFFMGRFVGQSTAALSELGSLCVKLEKRIETLETQGAERDNAQHVFLARLVTAEDAAKVLWKVRDEFIAMRATSEAEARHAREKMDSVQLQLSEVAKLVASRGGRVAA